MCQGAGAPLGTGYQRATGQSGGFALLAHRVARSVRRSRWCGSPSGISSVLSAASWSAGTVSLVVVMRSPRSNTHRDAGAMISWFSSRASRVSRSPGGIHRLLIKSTALGDRGKAITAAPATPAASSRCVPGPPIRTTGSSHVRRMGGVDQTDQCRLSRYSPTV